MTIEELQNKLIEKHKTKLDKDDPLLMVYTMNEYMLEDINKTYNQHVEELQKNINDMTVTYDKYLTDKANNMLKIYNKNIGDKTTEYVNSINTKTKEILNGIENNIEELEKYKTSNKYLTILLFCVLLINVFLVVKII